LTAFSASRMSFADSSPLDSRHNLRKTSAACKLSENLCSVLIKATTSERCRRLAFNRGLSFRMSKYWRTYERKNPYSKFFSSSSKRTFRAVARPVVWTFPQSLHLSHPMQSMIRLTFLKCCLNSSFRTCGSALSKHDQEVICPRVDLR